MVDRNIGIGFPEVAKVINSDRVLKIAGEWMTEAIGKLDNGVTVGILREMDASYAAFLDARVFREDPTKVVRQNPGLVMRWSESLQRMDQQDPQVQAERGMVDKVRAYFKGFPRELESFYLPVYANFYSAS